MKNAKVVLLLLCFVVVQIFLIFRAEAKAEAAKKQTAVQQASDKSSAMIKKVDSKKTKQEKSKKQSSVVTGKVIALMPKGVSSSKNNFFTIISPAYASPTGDVQPVRDVCIQSDGNPPVCAISNSNGFYEIEVGQGSRTFKYNKASYLERTLIYTVTQTTHLPDVIITQSQNPQKLIYGTIVWEKEPGDPSCIEVSLYKHDGLCIPQLVKTVRSCCCGHDENNVGKGLFSFGLELSTDTYSVEVTDSRCINWANVNNISIPTTNNQSFNCTITGSQCP
jgi:hypothetical protein